MPRMPIEDESAKSVPNVLPPVASDSGTSIRGGSRPNVSSSVDASNIEPLDEAGGLINVEGSPREVTMIRIDHRGNIVRQMTDRYAASHEIVDDPKVEEAKISSANEDAVEPKRKSGSITGRGGGRDSLTQSLVLLATMTVMLLGARFVVPKIVEEIRFAWHRGQLRAEYETAGDGLKNVSLSALSQAYQMVTSAVGPSVVHLDVTRPSSPGGSPLAAIGSPSPQRPGRGMFGGRFGGQGGLSDGPLDQGSGVIIDRDGYLLTNEHVVKGGGRVVVTLSDGRRRDATVVGVDRLTDLAVLKIDADGLMPIAWGDSDQCRVGSPVWAVGSPFGLDRTVTFGIISGKHRLLKTSEAYQDFMQSDVAVNPGNSGGPLVDADGRLVGINTAILGDSYQGVSFSIPSKVVRRIYESIRDTGEVRRAYLGVLLQSVPDDMLVGENFRQRGALVGGLPANDSPAGRAGVSLGDVIVQFDGNMIDDTAHLMRMVANQSAGNVVELEIRRRDKTMVIEVSLGAKPR